MKLHEFHVGENGASFVGDCHTVAGGNFGVGGFAINLPEATGGEKNGGGANFVERAGGFVNKTDARNTTVFHNQPSGERVRAKMKMRNFVRASEEGAADFSSRGIAMGMKNARTAVRGFASEGQLGAGPIKFSAPFDELGDVFGSFF